MNAIIILELESSYSQINKMQMQMQMTLSLCCVQSSSHNFQPGHDLLVTSFSRRGTSSVSSSPCIGLAGWELRAGKEEMSEHHNHYCEFCSIETKMRPARNTRKILLTSPSLVSKSQSVILQKSNPIREKGLQIRV